ncbi:MAG: methyltransferase domain-containing protein [Cyclobacteriaceae bacterium]
MKKGNNDILRKEELFHDQWAESIDVDSVFVDEFFEASTAPENRWIIKRMGNIKGLKVLELGAGAGEASVYLAKLGADVMATDISLGMLEVVKKLAKIHNVEVMTKQSLADKIDFENDSFDIVYAANLLHHVDIEESLKEINRVLRKGGRFYSWDPLAHNPAINIYRRQAMEVRTEDEHPIRWEQIDLFKKYFEKVDYECSWFFTLWIFVKFKFIDGVDPNKERYWKKIISEHTRLQSTFDFLEKIDKSFLKIIPFFKRWCWNITFECKK